MNPIAKKDLRISTRSMRIAWAIFAFEAVVAAIMLIAVLGISMAQRSSVDYTSSYEVLQVMFYIIAVIEYLIVALIMPIMTASSISGEKERQTFDILLTTPIKRLRIVWGKVISSTVRIMIFIIGSIPIMAVSFTLGGLSWGYLLLFLITMLIFAIFTGSFGVLVSTFTKRSIVSIIISYVVYSTYYSISIGALGIVAGLGAYLKMPYLGASGTAFLLANPAALILQVYLMFAGDGDGIVSLIYDEMISYNYYSAGGGSSLALRSMDIGWLLLSVVTVLGISFLCTLWAARRIDPMKQSKTK